MKKASKVAANLVVLENNDPINSEVEAIQSRIRQRAFELSHRRPQHASELYDWIAAESEIVSVPPVEVIEKRGTIEVKFALAGVNPDNLNIMATSEQILLKCDYSHEHESDVDTVHLCDFHSATVFRSVSLPQPIDVKSIKTGMENGVLRISASKQGARVPAKALKKAAGSRRGAAKRVARPAK